MTDSASTQLIAVDPQVSAIIDIFRRETGDDGRFSLQIEGNGKRLSEVNYRWVAPQEGFD